jgi:glycogen phosphorylase
LGRLANPESQQGSEQNRGKNACMSFANRPEGFESVAFPEPDGIVAYFSMEIALSPSIPTYSGGLGVLAGDTLRSAADLGLPLAAVTLLHRKGYFRQHLDANGVQTEEDQPWDLKRLVQPEKPIVQVTIEGRPVLVRAWRRDLEGITGHVVPVYLLDTDLEQNDPRDRILTDHLYGGDGDYRLAQEALLGIAGVRMLQALQYRINVYHMNEGHAALLTVALMEQQLQTNRILGRETANLLERMGGYHEGMLNMTYVALASSRFVNGVAMQHGKISRTMFPEYRIDAITNGVHAGTWTSLPMQAVFDRNMPRWRNDNVQLRYAIDIPTAEIQKAHAESKQRLIEEVAGRTGVALRSDIFTIGFARRVATYKRADLLFTDPERLLRCATKFGGIQVVYGGKAHPRDEPAKSLIRRIFEVATELKAEGLQVVYLENYEWELGALLTAGVDLWLNTPSRPYEASGTSGMKAALNGVPSLSVLDGWWIEGCLEGYTGWAIADKDTQQEEVASLYDRLESTILPLFYRQPEEWHNLMRSTVALNGSFFNTNRMLQQYVANAYYPQQNVNISTAALESVLAK